MVRPENKRVADNIFLQIHVGLTEQCFFTDFTLVSNELKYNALYWIV